MKKRKVHILIAGLIVLQLYFLIKISSLQDSIENTENAMIFTKSRLDNQINSIYRDVDQRLEEQASLIYKSSVKAGKLDVDTSTVSIIFTIEPKAVTETMSVFLDFDGEVIQLEKSGLKYSTTKDFGISDSILPKLIIEDNGVKSVEENEALMVSNIGEKVFPHIFVHFAGETSYGSYGSDKYRAKGKLYIDYKPAHENNPFVDMKYVIKVNDEIIDEKPVPLEKENGVVRENTFYIDDKYSIDKGQVLTSNIVAVDNLGFTHEYLVTHFMAGSDGQIESHFEKVDIIAPNGELFYQFD